MWNTECRSCSKILSKICEHFQGNLVASSSSEVLLSLPSPPSYSIGTPSCVWILASYISHTTLEYFPAQQTAVFMGCSAHQMYIMRFTPVRAHDRWSMSLCAVRLRGLKKATQSSPSALGMWGAYRCTFPKLNSWNWTLGFLSERSGAGREKALSPFPMITPDGVCTARVPEHKEAFEREAAFGDPTSPTSEGLPCTSPQY